MVDKILVSSGANRMGIFSSRGHTISGWRIGQFVFTEGRINFTTNKLDFFGYYIYLGSSNFNIFDPKNCTTHQKTRQNGDNF